MSHFATNRTNSGGRLALEWTRLRFDPVTLDRAAAWLLIDEPLVDLDQILRAIGYEQPYGQATEIRFRRLVAIAEHDDLAARIIVQRILPGLLAVVRRRRSASPHALDELLGAAWIATRTYNHRRSPSSIAASLISDADYAAFRSEGRKQSSTERPSDPLTHDRPHVHEPNSCEQLAALMEEAVEAGVPDGDLELLRQLLASPTANDLARDLKITTRTIRNRRDRITTRLREVALAA